MSTRATADGSEHLRRDSRSAKEEAEQEQEAAEAAEEEETSGHSVMHHGAAFVLVFRLSQKHIHTTGNHLSDINPGLDPYYLSTTVGTVRLSISQSAKKGYQNGREQRGGPLPRQSQTGYTRSKRISKRQLQYNNSLCGLAAARLIVRICKDGVLREAKAPKCCLQTLIGPFYFDINILK